MMDIDVFNPLDYQILARDGEPIKTLQQKPHSKGKHLTFDATGDA